MLTPLHFANSVFFSIKPSAAIYDKLRSRIRAKHIYLRMPMNRQTEQWQ